MILHWNRVLPTVCCFVVVVLFAGIVLLLFDICAPELCCASTFPFMFFSREEPDNCEMFVAEVELTIGDEVSTISLIEEAEPNVSGRVER